MNTLLDVLRALVEHAHFPLDEMKDQAHAVLDRVDASVEHALDSALNTVAPEQPAVPTPPAPTPNPEA